ncbi:MAG: cell division protein FtsZ [Bacteroidales bacterium]|nr:cell division protein FtsZ [Bacteroidales bacterium]
MEDMLDIREVIPESWEEVDGNILKVIGVGGGGCNAVDHMYRSGITDCSFIVCNTDRQALEKCAVPTKISMGSLGAGCDPIKGRNAAIQAADQIKKIVIDSKTEMLFITAGMGGGTGTGAAPVIASMAKNAGILTIGVVTLPFGNEGADAFARAVDGIREMQQYVDSLILINNDKLYDYFGDQLASDAFPKANDVVATAVKGIVEIITKPGFINVDFNDVRTVMTNSGMALMGYGFGRGENRIEDAVRNALESPLLNDFNLKESKNVLINITAGKNEQGLLMSEMKQITDKIGEYTGSANNFKRGLIWDDDPDCGDRISITVIVTGFPIKLFDKIADPSLGNYIYIDRNFRYEKPAAKADRENSRGTVSTIVPDSVKIGFSEYAEEVQYDFDITKKPALLLNPGEDRSMVESEPAVKRRAKQK